MANTKRKVVTCKSSIRGNLSECCQQLHSKVVMVQELLDANFHKDVRETAFGLNIPPSLWRDWLTDKYRDYDGYIVDRDGIEHFLDMEVLEVPHINSWFRDWACTRLLPNSRPRLRRESLERILVVASILRAVFPGEAMMWGVRADNDNQKILAYPQDRLIT